MIYDLLESYRSYLLSSYRPTTANTYYNRLGSLLSGQSLTDTVNKLDIEQVLNKLRQIKHKNYFSQSKNALLLFCQFQNVVVVNAAKVGSAAVDIVFTVAQPEVDNIDMVHLANLLVPVAFCQLLGDGFGYAVEHTQQVVHLRIVLHLNDEELTFTVFY